MWNEKKGGEFACRLLVVVCLQQTSKEATTSAGMRRKRDAGYQWNEPQANGQSPTQSVQPGCRQAGCVERVPLFKSGMVRAERRIGSVPKRYNCGIGVDDRTRGGTG